MREFSWPGFMVEVDDGKLRAVSGVTQRFIEVHVPSLDDRYVLLKFTITSQNTGYNDVCFVPFRLLLDRLIKMQ
jgi:hypothetical protein